MNHSKLTALIHELKFKGMEQILDEVMKQAEKKASSTYQTVITLLEEELRYRKEKSLINRIKNARIPWDWTLSSFPFARQPSVNKQTDHGSECRKICGTGREYRVYR